MIKLDHTFHGTIVKYTGYAARSITDIIIIIIMDRVT